MPGGRLGCTMFHFTAAECLQEFDDCRPIDDCIRRHHFLGCRRRWIAQAMFQANDGYIHLRAFLRWHAELATPTAPNTTTNSTTAATTDGLLLPTAATPSR